MLKRKITNFILISSLILSNLLFIQTHAEDSTILVPPPVSGTTESGSLSIPSIGISQSGSSTKVETLIDKANEKKTDLIDNLSGKKEGVDLNIETLKNEISKLDIEINTLENLNNTLKKEVSEKTDSLKSKDEENTKLSSKIEEYKSAIEQNRMQLAKLNGDRLNYSVMLEELTKLKISLEAQKDQAINEKVRLILEIFGLFIVLFTILSFTHNHYKNTEEYLTNSSKTIAKINLLEVLLAFSFILYLIGATLYLKPEFAIGFLFFGAAIITVFKDTILSFFASILFILNYEIGDEITIHDNGELQKGEIVKFDILNVLIKRKDHQDNFDGTILKFPNKYFYEKSIIKNRENYSKLVKDFVIVNFDSLELSKPKLNNTELNKFNSAFNFYNIQKEIESLFNIEYKNNFSLHELGTYSDFYKKNFDKIITYKDDGKISIKYEWIGIKENNLVLKEKLTKLILDNLS